MMLTLDEIRSVAFGALSVTQESDGFHFARFTQRQREVFGAENQRHFARCGFTTGCRLEFHTDSHAMIFETGAAGTYEILLDGLQTHFLQADGKRRYPIPLPGGDTRVTVLLPWGSAGVVSFIILDDGSYIRPHVFDRKILFLGDSITAGSAAKIRSLTFPYVLSQHLRADFLSWAVGGSHFSADTLEDVGYDPDIVVVAYGTNDYTFFKSPEDQEAACAEYLGRVKELFGGKQVFCISPIWRADGIVTRGAGSFEACRRRIVRQIELHGFHHIDGMALHPRAPEFFGDGNLHPNEYGYSVYARKLIEAMDPLLRG